jgi:hypothetical protein
MFGFTLASCAHSTVPTIAIPTATSGDIRLAADRSRYSVSEPIGVTLSNVSGTNYFATTGRSACTFLQLEQWEGQAKGWTPVDPCTTNDPTQSLLITTGVQEPFSLAPGSHSNPNAWQPGTYRVSLSYSAQSDGVTGAKIAYSSGFTIS